ncbi:MAG: hydantoinase/oxoprolinase family protein [Planctomycetia bacterium]
MTAPPVATDDLVALDVGGAAIKAADGRGWAATAAFPLWREWRRLPEALTAIVRPRQPQRLVATMTGEIADCFPSRSAGVAAIVAALEEAGRAVGCSAPVGIYLLDGSIAAADEARARPLAAAASNWHALARLAATLCGGRRSLLVDIGSTTTDIVPLGARGPEPFATDDAGRMRTGELVYTGIERTPLPALVRSLPHRGIRRPVASERFAESRDVWLLLGGLEEDAACRDTADGGPTTRDAARVRIARSLLLDPETYTPADAAEAAECCAAVQARLVSRALRRVAAAVGRPPQELVLAGHGTPLARRALAATGWRPELHVLADRLGAAVSRVAPAHAVAIIARGALG